MQQRSVVIRKPGGLNRLKIEESEVPKPAAGEILIEVRAAGINYADIVVRMGLYESARELVGFPITPGFEVSGVVSQCGAGVEKFSAGDDVIAVTLFNGYSSHVVVGEEYAIPKPESLSFAEAASMPAVFMTAWFSLFELGHPRPGSKILVHSAAGGVGGALMQLGRLRDCEMVGVVGKSHKVDAVRQLGATDVIDKSSEDLWKRAESIAPDGFDVICDANGVSTLGQSMAHLRRPGRLVVYGFASMLPRGASSPNWFKLAWDWLRTPRFDPMKLVSNSSSVLAFNLSYLFDEKHILSAFWNDFGDWVANGDIEPLKVETFALEDVAAAHESLSSGNSVGKLVLTP